MKSDKFRRAYLLHITTGTHVAKICLFLLNEARYLPGKILQLSPPRRKDQGGPGKVSVIDLDLSKYDRLAETLLMVLDQNQLSKIDPLDRPD